MDTQEADRQIKQMIAFIRQEAKEKAEEIRHKTNEEKKIEKLNYKAEESKLIRQEYERRKKEKLTQRKIHRSAKINEARFTVMQKRNDLLNNLKAQLLIELCHVPENPNYGKFIRYCIVEGLTIIMEEQVEVICRKEDKNIVEAELKAAKEDFIKLVKRECNVTPRIDIRLNQKGKFLPPHPSGGNRGACCRGGIVLTALGGKIKLSNTIESRVDQAFSKQKPKMRKILFGVRDPPQNAYGHGQ